MPRRFVLAILTIGAAGCASSASVAHPVESPARRGEAAVSAIAVAERPAIRITLIAAGADLWTVRAGVSGASRVELAGDFSNWDPVTLTAKRPGSWSVDVHVRSGVHQIALRVDGGPWTVPAGLAPVTDEFGGVAGVLIIPRVGDVRALAGSPPGEGTN